MNLRQYKQIHSLLLQLNVADEFHQIHEGKLVHSLKDHLRQLPDGWNAAPPPESADGRTITPLFVSSDFNVVYCVDERSRQIVEIDPHAPWPPVHQHDTWDHFAARVGRATNQDNTGDQETCNRLPELDDKNADD